VTNFAMITWGWKKWRWYWSILNLRWGCRRLF